MPSFPLSTPARATPGQAVSLALTMNVDPSNPLHGDLDLQDGQVHFWDQQASRRQKVEIICQFYLGEWFLDPTQGLPLFQRVLGSRVHSTILDILRKAFIKGLPDLAKILTLAVDRYDPSTRSLYVNFALLFNDGQVLDSRDFGAIQIGTP